MIDYKEDHAIDLLSQMQMCVHNYYKKNYHKYSSCLKEKTSHTYSEKYFQKFIEYFPKTTFIGEAYHCSAEIIYTRLNYREDAPDLAICHKIKEYNKEKNAALFFNIEEDGLRFYDIRD